MNKKTIIIIIGTILSVIGLFVLVTNIIKIKNTKDKINNAEQMSHNYAVNSTDTSTTTEELATDSSAQSMNTVITEETTEYVPPTNTFNVVNDVNCDRTDLDEFNISIDGKLVTLPCKYDFIIDIFGPLYIKKGKIDYIVDANDYTDITKLQLVAQPTTGLGLIQFTFTSDEPTNLSNCKCTRIDISSSSTKNEQLMTIALQNNIHWGSTSDEIFETFGKVTTSFECDINGNFEIYYERKNGVKLYFYGANDGLYQVSIDYSDYKIE